MGLLPLIVPPIYEKANRYADLLASIRIRAEEEIAKADRIIIFGYSFPDADFMAKSMIRRAIHKNPHIRDFLIIDIDPKICYKIASFCNLKCFRYARTVPEVTF
jgi:hypothetical protein